MLFAPNPDVVRVCVLYDVGHLANIIVVDISMWVCYMPYLYGRGNPLCPQYNEITSHNETLIRVKVKIKYENKCVFEICLCISVKWEYLKICKCEN